MLDRYVKNTSSFSVEEINIIQDKKVCVIGLGGLGGFVSQTLARFGVLNLTVVDGDRFTETNLNRQLFCRADTLGKLKAEVCSAELLKINENMKIREFSSMFTENNSDEILNGCDIAVDCLDNVFARLLLEEKCCKYEIPLIHGAIAGFYGQVSSVFPGDYSLKRIYGMLSGGVESKMGNPSFIPLIVASIQCCEVLKVLLGKGDILRNRLLFIDLLRNDFETIDLI